jgi:predicted AAA+ superfamily ATPase
LSIDYKTALNWFDYFCDSYFWFALKKFNFSILEVEKSMSKFYLVDNSFFSVNFLSINSLNYSTLFENQVFLEIKKIWLVPWENIFYYEEKWFEIDFIIFYEWELICIQVSYNIDNEATKQREIKSLNYVKEKYWVKKLILVLAEKTKSFKENDIDFYSFYDFTKYLKKLFKK